MCVWGGYANSKCWFAVQELFIIIIIIIINIY